MYLVGSLVLVALAGCGRVWFAEREAWRREAEVACLKSGAVKEGVGIAPSRPILGPGVCGADHPLKVSTLGDSVPGPALGYMPELRPPGAIPGHPLAAPPPVRSPYPASAGYPAPQAYPAGSYPAGPRARYGQPELDAIGSVPGRDGPDPAYRAAYPAPSGGPISISPPGVEPEDYDQPGDLVDAPQTPPRYPAAVPGPRPAYGGQPSYPARPMSPSRVPAPAAAQVEVKPSATLACPIVSALDQWLAAGVQPAAMRWLGQPVTEIKQISAYSCRSMNGQRGAPISEHAFGNALDIAAFTLADGRRVTVKDGWRGLPEEQGFLRDVHASACERFSTVLAPGSNMFHYDHIHVDLARRDSGRRICNPAAVPGDVVAARAGQGAWTARRDDPHTGSIGRRAPRWNARDERYDGALPQARPGED